MIMRSLIEIWIRDQMKMKSNKKMIKSVEQVRGPVVLDLMMAVPLKLLSVQSGVTVSVLHINLEDLSVDLDLILIKRILAWMKRKVKSVELVRVPVVLDLMMAVP